MDYQILEDVRNRLESYSPLSEYFEANYQYSKLRFFIGLKPSMQEGTAIPTDLFPYISIGPWRYKVNQEPDKNVDNTISLIFGIEDDREVNGVFMGVKAICDISQLIIKSLELQPITRGKVFNGATDIQFDGGALFPYFEATLLPVIETRRD